MTTTAPGDEDADIRGGVVTQYCPRGPRCEVCGREGDDLDVVVVPIEALGVGAWACLTCCQGCSTGLIVMDAPLPVTISTAGRLVQPHAAHIEQARLAGEA